MAHFQFSSPLIRGLTHSDVSVGLTAITALAGAVTPERRVLVVVQNKSTTNSIQVILADTGTSGIFVPPLGNITLDNYNGIVRVVASAVTTPVHIAYAVA